MSLTQFQLFCVFIQMIDLVPYSLKLCWVSWFTIMEGSFPLILRIIVLGLGSILCLPYIDNFTNCQFLYSSHTFLWSRPTNWKNLTVFQGSHNKSVILHVTQRETCIQSVQAPILQYFHFLSNTNRGTRRGFCFFFFLNQWGLFSSFCILSL